MGKKDNKYLWDNIPTSAFEDEKNGENADIAEFNKKYMEIYSANVNLFRQLPKITDGLKPIIRRILLSMYSLGLYPNKKSAKSSDVVATTMKVHPHGDNPIYEAMVQEIQYWKNNIPLIKGHGSFGDPLHPETYSAARYTRVSLSQYAYECFFKEFEPECIDTIPSSLLGEEFLYLPSRYPNLFLNGSYGLAIGNVTLIPAYNVRDVFNLFRNIIENGDETDNYYIYPDVPSPCDIIENGRDLKDLVDTGRGKLIMRARIDIEEDSKYRYLCIRSLPWLCNYSTVKKKLVELKTENIIPILDVMDDTSPYTGENGEVRSDINIRIQIPKTQDPYYIRNLLYKKTTLQINSTAILKITTDDLKIQSKSLRSLAMDWLEDRRDYKRRLCNKKIFDNMEKVAYLKVLVDILGDRDKLFKVVGILHDSKRSEVMDALINKFGINSFQANKLAKINLLGLNKEDRDNAREEIVKLNKETKEIKKIAESNKKIDALILDELEGMLKYDKPKKCRIITTHNEQLVTDEDMRIVFSKKGFMKKLTKATNRKIHPYGTFQQGDYPISVININNLETLLIFDSLGRYTMIPVHYIPHTDFSENGNKTFDIVKLEGDIIYTNQYLPPIVTNELEEFNEKIYLVSLSSQGLLKKTDFYEINTLDEKESIKKSKYARVKDGDNIIFADLILDSSNIVIYTAKGQFTYIEIKTLELSPNTTMGRIYLSPENGDECRGFCPLGAKDDYIILLTERGMMKKIDSSTFFIKKRGDTSYISKVDEGDSIISCKAANKGSTIVINTRVNTLYYNTDDIPLLTRKASPQKIVPVPQGDNIIDMIIYDPSLV